MKKLLSVREGKQLKKLKETYKKNDNVQVLTKKSRGRHNISAACLTFCQYNSQVDVKNWYVGRGNSTLLFICILI